MSSKKSERRELPSLTTTINKEPIKKKDEKIATKENNRLKKAGKKIIKKNDIGRVLESIREDIVTSELPYREFYTNNAVSISGTKDHVYMEGSRKFKKTKTSQLNQVTGSSLTSTNLTPNPFTALHFHKAFKTVSLLLNGLLAGIMAWQLASVFGSSVPTLDHYPPLSINLHSVYYFITTLCIVAALDRFDFSQPRLEIYQQLLSRQSITPLLLISFHLVGLLTSLATFQWDLDIGEHHINDDTLFESTQSPLDSNVNTAPVVWQVLNVIRAVMAFLSWFLVSMSPLEDKFTQVLENFEKDEVEPANVIED